MTTDEPGSACLVCGAPHATCGPGSSAAPVDQLTTIPKGDPVTTKKYRTTVNGHATTLKLSDADAKAWEGAELTEVGAEPEAPETKARTAPANKSRTTGKD